MDKLELGLVEEIERLAVENAELRKRIRELEGSDPVGRAHLLILAQSLETLARNARACAVLPDRRDEGP